MFYENGKEIFEDDLHRTDYDICVMIHVKSPIHYLITSLTSLYPAYGGKVDWERDLQFYLSNIGLLVMILISEI